MRDKNARKTFMFKMQEHHICGYPYSVVEAAYTSCMIFVAELTIFEILANKNKISNAVKHDCRFNIQGSFI